jgi:hypothetical protein
VRLDGTTAARVDPQPQAALHKGKQPAAA